MQARPGHASAHKCAVLSTAVSIHARTSAKSKLRSIGLILLAFCLWTANSQSLKPCTSHLLLNS